jgi:3-hydroxyacyl-CoA dehydrogenase
MKIKKVAVLGSGVMGSQLACHFANIGLEVLLLDIVPFDLKEHEKDDPKARNRLVNGHLSNALKMSPSPIYKKSFAKRIATGNFDDDMSKIKDCDWVLEVVIENLEIKKQIFEKVELHRTPGTLISSNTSGIPIEMMIQGRSDDFKKYFLGTHFFNPPRYLKLLEIIPSSATDPAVVDFFMQYGDKFLGKSTVECKDTPAFIANRVGVFSIMAIFHLMDQFKLTIEEVDVLTGPLTGKPKSATFRTCDVVGIDTLVKVANGVKDNCPEDEAKALFSIPGYVNQLIENGWLGAKSGQGFYKKVKGDKGKSEIHALDIEKMEYRPKQKARFASVELARTFDSLKERLVAMHKGKDNAADFLNQLAYNIFSYVSHRIPEIADDLYKIDHAVKAGFGWEAGPFEHWDILGLENVVNKMKTAGQEPASWVLDMLKNGNTSFYKLENGIQKYYDLKSGSYKEIPGMQQFIILDNLRSNTPVFQNSGCTLHDIGDGVVCLEFHTKMNAIGSEILEGINKSIDLATEDFKGLVIGNDAPNFSAGANLAMMLMLAIEQEFDELDFAIRYFQNTVMKLRYSPIPVVMAPHGLTLGGGCEMSMHADSTIAAAETYIGLVEVGAGLIPAGGGTKEMVLRASDSYTADDTQIPKLRDRFINIATAKVATSGHEAIDLGILLKGKDRVIVNNQRVIAEAKAKVIALDRIGYTQPIQRDDITVLGRTALGAFYSGTEAFYIGGYATEYDRLIANKLAWVMAGGDLTGQQKVTEQYLLDLEREAFLSLLGEKKTLERIQHILKTGKPLRN